MVKMRMLGTTVARVEKQKSFTLCSQQRKQTTLPEDKPRRLIEGNVQTGQDVDKAVKDDQIMDSRSLLPENDLACPGVDHNSDHREDDVGVEVATGLAHVYLRQHNKGWMEREKGNTSLVSNCSSVIVIFSSPLKKINPIFETCI